MKYIICSHPECYRKIEVLSDVILPFCSIHLEQERYKLEQEEKKEKKEKSVLERKKEVKKNGDAYKSTENELHLSGVEDSSSC